MNPNFPTPERDYSRSWAQQLLNRIARLFGDCFMKGSDLRLENGEKLVLKDRVTGQRWDLYVSNGVITREEVS